MTAPFAATVWGICAVPEFVCRGVLLNRGQMACQAVWARPLHVRLRPCRIRRPRAAVRQPSSQRAFWRDDFSDGLPPGG